MSNYYLEKIAELEEQVDALMRQRDALIDYANELAGVLHKFAPEVSAAVAEEIQKRITT